uniref:Fas activated serine/threonine kinase n=1 Tax=Corvus moneduloides TaxID=1196302 RepID=A0A8U7M0Z0_CORMO
MLCPLLCPWLRALTRAGPRGPAARERRGAAMFPACCCAGKARPRLLLPLDPYGHGLLPTVHPDGGRGRTHGKRKSWNFIHEKMSYDTFFTMKRLIERSRSVGEVLRWVTQNPGKVSASHYPIALHKLGQLLQQQPGPPMGAGDGRGPAGQVLEQPEFHVLCQAIVSGCAKFDNFSIVNCLYAAAALGLPGESPLVRVLEDESRSRLGRFNQKDVSMVFSSVMRLHPSSPHPLVESCLSSLERHLEKERHPQTLFLLLSYYRLRAQALQGHAASDQQLINNRKILRLVRHTLGQVSAMREHELALLDEMLALCAQEANNKALEAIFSSQLFYENRQERFIRSMAGDPEAGVPLQPDELPPLQPRRALSQAGGHPGAEGQQLTTGHRQHPHVHVPAQPLPTDCPAPGLLPRLHHQCHEQPLRADCAPVPVAAGCGGGAGVPRVQRPPPRPALPRPHVRARPDCRRGQQEVQLQGAGGRGAATTGGGGMLPAGRGAPPWVLHRLPAVDQPLRHGAASLTRSGSFQGSPSHVPRHHVPAVQCPRPHLRLAGLCPICSRDAQQPPRPPGERPGRAVPAGALPGSSTLSSPSECLSVPPPSTPDCSPRTSTTSLFQFPIGKILEEEEETAGCPSQEHGCFQGERAQEEPEERSLPASEDAGPPPSPCRPSPKRGPGEGPQGAEEIQRVVLSVNDKWHYCQNSDILVGSRAMRDRHLRLLGYCLVQLPYTELEKVSGIEEAKHYLRQKLRELRF